MQKVNLNLIPGSVLPVINVSQYDEGRQFQLAIFNGAASYDLTGKTVMVDVQKTDGHGCEYGAADDVKGVPVVAVSGNIVTITTPQQMTACAGDCAGELKITDSTSTIGTLNFILMCEPAPLNDETIISDTELPDIIDAARSSAERAEDAAQDAEAAAAHYPYIGDDGYWYEWDVETEQFVKTDVSAAGRAPDITMTATADATSSPTPTVTVTKTGTDEEPNFALAFSGLKGAKGDKGDTGPVGPAGDIADIEEAVGWTGNNLFEGLDTVVGQGSITVTRQNDKKYLVAGTRTGTGAVILFVGSFTCKAGQAYALSGCPTGGGTDSGFWLDAYPKNSTSTYYARDFGSGATIPAFNADTEIRLGIRIPQGYTCPANFLWSPMISRNGGEYVPYHPTVQQELWDGEVAEPKNVLPPNVNSVSTGLTYNFNDDGSITIYKTATSSAALQLRMLVPSTVSGNYYFWACPNIGSQNIDAYMWDSTTNARCKKWDGTTASESDYYGIPQEVQIVPGHTTLLQIRLAANYTTPAGGITFKPMISLYKGAYSPYYVPLKDVVPTKFSSSNVAPTEDGATASQNIAVNDLFIRGGALCICDQPISLGGSFTEETNYHKTTLAAVIAALRA